MLLAIVPFFLKFMCISVIVCCVYVGAHGGQKEALNPLELDYKQLWATKHGFWEPNSNLEEQWVSALLTANPSLQPLIITF